MNVATGRLTLVATPIGNLGDLSPRSVEVLAASDVIYCEDTRRTRALLSHAGVQGAHLVSLHEHNEISRVPEIVADLEAGHKVAVVSDAGMPAIADPGRRAVEAAVALGAEVDAVPGPNAAVLALVLSGFATDRFCFEGWLPRKGPERRGRLDLLAKETRTVVIYESPRRVAGTLADLRETCGDQRPVVVAREMTKIYQQTWRGTLEGACGWTSGADVRGEVVIVLAGAEVDRVREVADGELRAAIGDRLAGGASVRDAAAQVAAELGVSRRRAYEEALALHGGVSGS
jgi:16S rRNA (cytidine1402-2'-O)-methyltransferase